MRGDLVCTLWLHYVLLAGLGVADGLVAADAFGAANRLERIYGTHLAK